MRFWYRVCFVIARVGLFFWHPVFRVHGKENIPQGAAVLTANHASGADPIWILFALNEPDLIRILSKAELRKVPFVGWVMEKFRIIFVRRGEHDVNAFKSCLKALRGGEKLLLFIEGTRWRKDKPTRARTGAIRMAAASDVPLVPIYITREKKPFAPVDVIFGEPIQFAEELKKADHDALQLEADRVLYGIYKMGGDSNADHVGENSGLLLRS